MVAVGHGPLGLAIDGANRPAEGLALRPANGVAKVRPIRREAAQPGKIISLKLIILLYSPLDCVPIILEAFASILS